MIISTITKSLYQQNHCHHHHCHHHHPNHITSTTNWPEKISALAFPLIKTLPCRTPWTTSPSISPPFFRPIRTLGNLFLANIPILVLDCQTSFGGFWNTWPSGSPALKVPVIVLRTESQLGRGNDLIYFNPNTLAMINCDELIVTWWTWMSFPWCKSLWHSLFLQTQPDPLQSPENISITPFVTSDQNIFKPTSIST